MANPSPRANRVKAGEAEVRTIQGTAETLETVGTSPKLLQTRPKSAHCDFRESRLWAKSNAEWIDNGKTDVHHTLYRRRASEDLLRSRPLPATPLAPKTEPHSHHQRTSSDAESLAQAHNINCLSRSLSTGNWLNIRRDSAHRKIQVHHQLGRFVRKITDTSNWASKEPTASLNQPEEEKDSDSLVQTAPQHNPRNLSTRRVAKLTKKPGMDNIRAQKEVADSLQEKYADLNADAIINLNAAEDTPKRSGNIPALLEKDIEEIKRRSANLREALSEYQSDRHGNLLPEINTDAIGDVSSGAQPNNERHATSASAPKPRYASEQLRGIDSIENTAWKTSYPSSGKSPPSMTLSPPQPGPRVSSRHSAASSSTVRRVDGSPLAGRSAVLAPAQSSGNESPDSFVTFVEPPDIAAIIDQTLASQLQERTSTGTLSVLEAPPTKSTDTLTAITNEALGNGRPTKISNLAEPESVALNPSTRPKKLHSGFVSSAKALGDAPNRPLPDLPEVPSPKSSEASRRDGGSRASSRSRRSLPRMSSQPSQNRRSSSFASIASLDGMLQGNNSPHSSPRRRSISAKKSGSVQSSSQKRSSDLSNVTDATGPISASVEKSAEVVSPGLGQRSDFAAPALSHDTRDTVSRDQRIHDKRLQDIASARAKRGKRATHADHQSIQEDPVAEDFPTPPSSRPPSQTTVDRQRSDPRGRGTTANTSAAYLQNSAGLQGSQAEHMSLASDPDSLANHDQSSQISRATSSSRGASPALMPGPTPVPAPVANVTEHSKYRQVPKAKHSQASLRSSATIANTQLVHGTQTPPLSESSTPSSDEDGTGVVGAAIANKAKTRRRLHVSATDLAAMAADMRAMREQLDMQMRKIQSQSKQIRAIEIQKLRVVDAVNALVAVVSEPSTVVPMGLRGNERNITLMEVNPHLGWRDRDSIASTSNTVASAGSASSGSGSPELTFITEPDAFSNRLESVGAQGQDGMEFNMDFDRMQELVRLDRRKVGSELDQEGKAKGSRRKKSSGAVGYLSIHA
jgi:hypothetical protein